MSPKNQIIPDVIALLFLASITWIALPQTDGMFAARSSVKTIAASTERPSLCERDRIRLAVAIGNERADFFGALAAKAKAEAAPKLVPVPEDELKNPFVRVRDEHPPEVA
jgi:hypothetical protein